MNSPQLAPADAHKKSIYYPWFDWLRAVCACTVMLYHDGLFRWTHAGDFAVKVFFALSGWLIGGMLLKLKAEDLTRFYFNRAIRIWAPYYLAGALLLTISVFREPITAKWLEIVIYKVTFVYNLFGPPQLAEFKNAMPQKATLNHFWSVNAEEQFYLIAPIFLVLGARFLGRSIPFWGALTLLACVTNTYAAIVLGVMAAIVVDRFGVIHLTKVGRIGIFLVLISGLYCIAADFAYEWVAPITGLAIVLILATPSTQHRLGALFGGMSYPLYLNHWIGVFALNFLMPGMRDDPVRHALSAVANIAFAMFLYWFVDRRLLERRNAWFTPQCGLMLTVMAYAMVFIGISYGFWMTLL